MHNKERHAAVGAVAWVIGVAVLTTAGQVGWAESLLFFGALVIVPLGIGLIDAPRRGSVGWRIACACHLLAAVLLIPALCVPRGTAAALWTLPYLAVTALWAAGGGIRLLRRGPRPLWELSCDVGLMYLLGAGGWTLLSRLGARPVEFQDEIVQLTAVHMHYVGFALPLLAALAARANPGRAANLACVGALLGFPLVAAAMTITQTTGSRAFELVAIALLAVTCCLLAIVQFQASVRSGKPAVLALLSVSGVSLITAMGLAVVYGLGQALGVTWLDIPTMLPTHGLLNAFGFVFGGLCAWHLHDPEDLSAH